MEEFDTILKTLEGEKNLTAKQISILEAAVEVFAEKGYASASTSEIAQRANVAEGTIFRHYKTKKQLLVSIITPFMMHFTLPIFAAKFTKEVFDETPEHLEDMIKKLLVNRFEFAKENTPLLKIVLQEMAFHKDLQEKFQQMFLKEVYPKFQEVIRHFKEKGVIIDYPDATLIRMIMSVIIGFLVTRFLILPDSPWEDEKEMERTIHFILNGITK